MFAAGLSRVRLISSASLCHIYIDYVIKLFKIEVRYRASRRILVNALLKGCAKRLHIVVNS
jgi:hypothetical protein